MRRIRAATGAALELEVERGILFLFVPVLLGIGAIVYFSLPAEPRLAHLLVAFGVAGAGAFAVRRRRRLLLSLLAIAVGLGGLLAAKMETERRSTKMLGSAVTTRLTGRVAAVDHLASGRTRFVLDVLTTERPVLRFAPDRVRVTARRLPDTVFAGMTVSGLVRLMPPSGPSIPGGYDFSFESYFDGVGATGFFLGKPTVSQDPVDLDRASWAERIENVRQRLAGRIREAVGGEAGEIAAALIVGVRGGIPEEVNEALRRTGLAHILSISGLHMALVAGAAMVTGRAFFALFPLFASRYAVKKLAALGALAAVGCYVLFSGADVAALRSFIMLAIMLTAVLFDRAALTMRNLAIAATVILLWRPHEILGPSFQMSFAATAALVTAYAEWPGRNPSRPRPGKASSSRRAAAKIASTLLALAATSLVAGLATLVFGIYHFQRVSPLSLPANMLVAPIVSLLVMPPALLAMLAMPFGLDGPFFAVMGFGLRLMIAITHWLSVRSPVDAVGTIPLATMALVSAAILCFAIASTWLRYVSLALAALGLALVPAASRPAVLVSEDAQLIAVAGDGTLAVNTRRGGSFTVENWQRAAAASSLVPPVDTDDLDPPAPAEAQMGRQDGAAFRCRQGFCLAKHDSGWSVGWSDAVDGSTACGKADILVVTTAARPHCSGRRGLILTKRDLAIRGAAAIRLTRSAEGRPLALPAFAIPQPLRPWHEHRRFTRAARGLEERPPLERKRNGGSSPSVEALN